MEVNAYMSAQWNDWRLKYVEVIPVLLVYLNQMILKSS